MQIELRKIDGQDFIAATVGKKQFIRTPAETVEIEERNIADAICAIADAQASATLTQQAIEAALLAGESAEALRTQLADEQQIITGFTRDIAESKASIRQVFKLIDDHAANEIRQAAAARLAALLAPHDQALKEFAQ